MKFFILILVPLYAFASLESEVNSTSELRKEVELLSLEIENLKKGQQSEMDVYIQRFQEVTSQVLKEEFRAEQLKTQIQLGQQKLAAHAGAVKSNGRESWLISFWKKYDDSLKTANPLISKKLQERLEKLRIDLQQKKISYEHALLQTWFVMESDLSKSQEAEFVLAPLQIKDKLLHVEMVRLGRNKGYFRTAEGQYGQLLYKDAWKTNFFEEESSKEMIEVLLTQFKQQQKTGLYQLPGIQL